MNTDTDTNISGRVVVITGASRGLGEATARYLDNGRHFCSCNLHPVASIFYRFPQKSRNY